ncbi:putative conjugative transfer protein TraB [Legionella busanensis]|uniref:Putative conjugative transfer protein TraB n=1 Tax=Legionella busanensis TaxID=190655 RepID=A0A378K959_9GAMM|nr:TrbI/VirB10 family protein [Legionella busanensis]STX81257.1 putative conjugative transfer protein TraB [Legionella busanensis]
MKEKLKALQTKLKSKHKNINMRAKREQTITALSIACVCISFYGFYLYTTKHRVKPILANQEIAFDGVFDSKFSQDSDEAVLLKQQKEIDELTARFKKTEENLKSPPIVTSFKEDEETKKLVQALSEKLNQLEKENIHIFEKLQVAMLKGQQASLGVRPPTKEEMAEKLRRKALNKRSYYQNAGLETVRFNSSRKGSFERRPDNYVWAGTFVSGIMLTGVMGDAGVNGQKNTGTVLIRLDENGTMPNGKRSRLKDCFVLGSSYGDLSGDSVVIHTETLSCASNDLNFEIKVYGSVYDQDAMQDVRGTPILKTKPLLEYTAAAGLIAGIGDGLSNYGSIQSINPDGSLSKISPSSIGRMAAGGAIINPANKVSEYIMKITDIYHPLVVARAGRRVSVMFIKGFWIDKAHQKFESEKAIDNEQAQLEEKAVTTTITRVNSHNELINSNVNQPVFAKINQEIAEKQKTLSLDKSNAEQSFLAQKGYEPKPLFSESNPGDAP